MSRYIDAEAIHWHDDGWACIRKDEYPTIDIVRCGECRYFIDNLTEADTDEMYDSCRWDWSRKIPTADDFCSYGEREGE